MVKQTEATQTEAEERLALLCECGRLSGRVLDLTGHLPVAIKTRLPVDFRAINTVDIAVICDEIRAECPAAAESTSV
jgi:hypothetical protein